MKRLVFRGFRALLPSMRTLRVVAYATFAFTVLGLAGARVLYADMREATTHLGKTLTRFADLTGDADTIRLNGAQLHEATAFTDMSTKDVLDRYEASCASSSGVLGKSIQEVLAKHPEAAPPGAMRFGVVRDDNDEGGMVVCFEDESPSDPHRLKEKLEAFVKTHDLSTFGHLRFATATRIPDGGTRVRTIWTDGALDLHAMFPANADAPGGDSTILPRPPSSRLVVSAAAEGQPYSVRIYKSHEPLNTVSEMYEREMAARGFTRTGESSADGTGYLREDGLLVFVALAESEGATAVSLVEGGRNAGITGYHAE